DGNLTWVRVSDTQIIGSDDNGAVVHLDLVVTGNNAQVTATLLDNYTGHTVQGDDSVGLGSVKVIATDTDGDMADGTVTVTVSDDVPVVNVSGATTVVEGGAAIAGTWSLFEGADGVADAAFTISVNDGP